MQVGTDTPCLVKLAQVLTASSDWSHGGLRRWVRSPGSTKGREYTVSKTAPLPCPLPVSPVNTKPWEF